MTDTTVINPDQPYRMPDQGAVDAWRAGTPASPMAPQSPLSALGPPPTPTPPPQYPKLNTPPMPQQPTQQQLGPAPDAKDYQKGAMEFASAMAVLGAVASKFTRVSGTAALSAFAGALNGWKQGNLQAYEEAAQKWEQDTKATLENNRQIMQQYKLALENRKMNIDEQMSQIQLVSAQYHDKMMYDAAASKNYTLVANIYEKNVEFTQRAQLASDKLMESRKKDQQTAEEKATYWLSPEGQARLSIPEGQPGALTTAQKAGAKQLIDIYASKSAKPQNAALTKFLEENPNATAQEIQNFQQASRPPRSAAAMSLQKFIQENPQATSADIQAFQAKQAELSTEARTKATRETNLDIILRVTDSAIPAALAASDKVPRGSFVPLNQIIQKGQLATSNPALMQFGMANLQLAEGWARAMNPTGVMRESDRDKALSFLSTATSPETYKALVEQLRTQIQRERAAIQSGKQSAVAAPGEMPSASESTGAGWTNLGTAPDGTPIRIREK